MNCNRNDTVLSKRGIAIGLMVILVSAFFFPPSLAHAQAETTWIEWKIDEPNYKEAIVHVTTHNATYDVYTKANITFSDLEILINITTSFSPEGNCSWMSVALPGNPDTLDELTNAPYTTPPGGTVPAIKITFSKDFATLLAVAAAALIVVQLVSITDFLVDLFKLLTQEVTDFEKTSEKVLRFLKGDPFLWLSIKYVYLSLYFQDKDPDGSLVLYVPYDEADLALLPDMYYIATPYSWWKILRHVEEIKIFGIVIKRITWYSAERVPGVPPPTLPPQPPCASFEWWPTCPSVDQWVTFVSTSYDPDGEIKECVWWTGEYPIPTIPKHYYTEPGTYTVKLKVTDSQGLSSETSASIVVLPRLETINTTCIHVSPYELAPQYLAGGIPFDYEFTPFDTVYVSGMGYDTSQTVRLSPIADAFTDENSPNTNFGDFAGLVVKARLPPNLAEAIGTTPWEREWTWIKFNLSSIPQDAVIDRAELKIYAYEVGGYNEAGDAKTWTWQYIDAYHSVDDSWTELGITWNNQPLPAASPTDTVDWTSLLFDKTIDYFVFHYGPPETGWKTFDVTSDVQSDSTSGDYESTWVLRGDSEAEGDYAEFISRDATGEEPLGPYLPYHPHWGHAYLEVRYRTGATYDIHIVEDRMWLDGDTIPQRVAGTSKRIKANANGELRVLVGGKWEAQAVWHPPLIPGKYDIIIDVNDNGEYDLYIDVLCNDRIKVTAGFFVIPELPLGTVTALLLALVALVLFRRWPLIRIKP